MADKWIPLGLGMVIGALSCGVMLNRFLKSDTMGRPTPESRLTPTLPSSLVIPAGFFIFGWTTQFRVQWVAPLVGTALIGFGWTSISICVRGYIVDAFGIYAVSAVSAMLVVRNVAAALLPLVAPSLYERLDLGWGSTLLGFIGFAFAPVPILLIRYGAYLRRSSSITTKE